MSRRQLAPETLLCLSRERDDSRIQRRLRRGKMIEHGEMVRAGNLEVVRLHAFAAPVLDDVAALPEELRAFASAHCGGERSAGRRRWPQPRAGGDGCPRVEPD